MLNEPANPFEPDDPPKPDRLPERPDVIPTVVPPLPRENLHARHLPMTAPLTWLRKGWSDLWTNPLPSLLYGLAVFVLSVLVLWSLFRLDLGSATYPALAGFLVVGPLVANGLYEKSRRLEEGERMSFREMVYVRAVSGYQALFMGVIMLMLFMLWLRAAVILYALFFGVVGFPGFDEVGPMLVHTEKGWGLLIAGSAVGALFAAFAFATSVFAAPMMLEERTDALSAMGISMAMTWNNLRVMIAWGAIVLLLFLFCVATYLVGLIVVFPLLGHATWHCYRAIRGASRKGQETERMFIQPA